MHNILKYFYELKTQEEIKGCAGAQLIDGKWYAPLHGCDTIQTYIDDTRESDRG